MPRALRHLNFTKASIEELPAAAKGSDYYNDTKIRGLQLAVTQAGAKTYYLYGRIGGNREAINRLDSVYLQPLISPSAKTARR